ncbi:MAG: hypothetical protein KAW12_17720 [Candidatus Aminicenantes bacterium]|nr:hypothetical protein [Candidatus Aminicenantes bacterium]
MIVDLPRLKEIAEIEFYEIVSDVIMKDINELRIILIDGSFIDLWFSLKLEGRFSYHWERGHVDGSIYRHDNAQHRKWKAVPTFPKHFHIGDEETVVESNLDDEPGKGLSAFLSFVKGKILLTKT